MSPLARTLFGILSIGGMASFALFVSMIYRSGSSDQRIPIGGNSRKQWYVFAGAVTVVFGVCMYQGADFLLSWMPRSWGKSDEYGEFSPAADTLAILFVVFVGIPLLAMIFAFPDIAVRERRLALERRELSRILEASHSLPRLQQLLAEYRAKQRHPTFEHEVTAEEQSIGVENVRYAYLALEEEVVSAIRKVDPTFNEQTPVRAG